MPPNLSPSKLSQFFRSHQHFILNIRINFNILPKPPAIPTSFHQFFHILFVISKPNAVFNIINIFFNVISRFFHIFLTCLD